MSFVAGFTAGLMAGKKKFGGSGGSDNELWTPPANWSEVPEPGANEAIFLIDTTYSNSFALLFCDPKYIYPGRGTISIDWGDGNSYSGNFSTLNDDGTDTNSDNIGPNGPIGHSYTAAGQYIVKVTTDKFNCFLASVYSDKNATGWQGCGLLIAKLGENIRICPENPANYSYTAYGSFTNCRRLKWLVKKGNCDLLLNDFLNCYSLKRVDFENTFTEIPESCFSGCYALKFNNIDFSKVTKIDNSAFSSCYNLQKISAPLCTSVGSSAFSECYALEKAEFAEGCTFGSGAFNYCYQLFPDYPGGSTNYA